MEVMLLFSVSLILEKTKYYTLLLKEYCDDFEAFMSEFEGGIL